jgi:hypothetical protein
MRLRSRSEPSGWCWAVGSCDLRLIATLACFGLAASGQDRYPLARKLLLGAEPGIPLFPTADTRNSMTERIVVLYARSGYLGDARRLHARRPAKSGAVAILIGTAVYEGVDKALATGPGGGGDARAYLALAQALWAMANADGANRALAIARTVAREIAAPAKRSAQLNEIAEWSERMVAEPSVAGRTAAPAETTASSDKPAAIPLFPITASGFRMHDPAVLAKRQAENLPYLEKLYALAGSGNVLGALKLALNGSSPFQTSVGLATVAHLALLGNNMTDVAERAVIEIPEDQADATLAKAEALASMGAVYAKAGSVSAARRCFHAARRHLRAVTDTELAYGKSVVAADTAAKLYESREPELGAEAFNEAMSFAAVVPKEPPRHTDVPSYQFRLRADAFREIMERRLRVNDIDGAGATAQSWMALGPDRHYYGVSELWIKSGHLERAAEIALAIREPISRTQQCLRVAGFILDRGKIPAW